MDMSLRLSTAIEIWKCTTRVHVVSSDGKTKEKECTFNRRYHVGYQQDI